MSSLHIQKWERSKHLLGTNCIPTPKMVFSENQDENVYWPSPLSPAMCQTPSTNWESVNEYGVSEVPHFLEDW